MGGKSHCAGVMCKKRRKDKSVFVLDLLAKTRWLMAVVDLTIGTSSGGDLARRYGGTYLPNNNPLPIYNIVRIQAR